MGQMLRGGRSWLSDRKVRAGAAKRGKAVVPALGTEANVGSAVMSGVAEHEDTQWRPLSAPVWPWSCC